jgi:hypothetical protein
MQTGCHQTDNAVYGFALETAEALIAAKGYYLFIGSTRLLETRSMVRTAIPQWGPPDSARKTSRSR